MSPRNQDSDPALTGGADDADREDRTVELHGEPSGTRATLVEPPVAAARDFGKDAEQLTAPENLRGGVESIVDLSESELLAAGGLYARLWNLQQAEEAGQ